MSGLVTLLSERLETIARLWDAGLPAWAYASCEQARAYSRWINISVDVSGISKTNEWISFSFLYCDLHVLDTDTYVLLSLISSLPFSWQPSTPTPPTLHFSSITVLVTEALPMLIIVGGAVGGGCVLLICVITLVSLCCRHTGKGELNG